MLKKVTISRMFAVAVVFGVLSGTSVHAGVKIEKAKTVLRTAAKVTALGVTGTATVAGTLTLVNKTVVADMVRMGLAVGRMMFCVNDDLDGLTRSGKCVMAVPTALCGAASYKLAKNLFKSYKNRNA